MCRSEGETSSENMVSKKVTEWPRLASLSEYFKGIQTWRTLPLHQGPHRPKMTAFVMEESEEEFGRLALANEYQSKVQ